MRLMEPDVGASWPEPIANSEFVLAVDQVIKAIGQEPPSLATLLGLETEKGKIRVN